MQLQPNKNQPDETKYSSDEIGRQICDYICCKFGFLPGYVQKTDALRRDLALDSFDELELYSWAEDAFGVPVLLVEFDGIKTVEDLVGLIFRKYHHYE